MQTIVILATSPGQKSARMVCSRLTNNLSAIIISRLPRLIKFTCQGSKFKNKTKISGTLLGRYKSNHAIGTAAVSNISLDIFAPIFAHILMTLTVLINRLLNIGIPNVVPKASFIYNLIVASVPLIIYCYCNYFQGGSLYTLRSSASWRGRLCR